MAKQLFNSDGSPVKYQDKDVFGADFVGVVKDVNLERRTMVMTGTDETKDRDGDIIRLSGWDLDNYRKNPVFLWAHSYGSVPLAAAEKVVRKREPARMDFYLRYPTLGIYPFSDMILNLYSEKIINASSVGFIPNKWNPMPPDEEGNASFGREFIKQELLELSGCAVPSNPNALQNALKGKSYSKEFGKGDLVKFLMGDLSIPNPEKADDVLEFIDSCKTEIEDETTAFQIQVPKEFEIEKDTTDPDPTDVLDKEKYHCECISCGYKMESEKHCKDLKCPKCGGEMRREERPGPGRMEEDIDEIKLEDILEDLEITQEDKEEILRPYPNEHACRLLSPSDFDSFARKNCFKKIKNKCVDFIFGIKEGKSKVQALRFNKEVWGADDARSACSSMGGSFEAAKPNKETDMVELVSIKSEVEDDIKEIKEKTGKISLALESMAEAIKSIPVGNQTKVNDTQTGAEAILTQVFSEKQKEVSPHHSISTESMKKFVNAVGELKKVVDILKN